MDRWWTSRALVAATAVVSVAAGGCAPGGSSSSASDVEEALPPATAVADPDAPQDMTFDDPGERPYTVTADDPLSTFAVDVDTGSYSVARAYLDEEQLPPAESVRVEEFVNTFDPGFPAAEGVPLALHADGGPAPLLGATGERRLLRVGLTTEEPGERTQRAALTFVIDVSGSMEEDGRLELAVDSLSALVAQLRPDDTVAVVAYSDEARLVLPPTAVERRGDILEALGGLEPQQSTNVEAGLRLGYEQARAGFLEGGSNRVVLLSDGVANVGSTDPGGILATVGEQARDGVQLVTVGVGMGNYDDAMMEQLANRGDGFYSYVDTRAEADELFGDGLLATLQVVAEEAKLQVEVDPAAVARYRLVGFENRDVPDEAFRDDLADPSVPRADAGELGPGHTVTALYEIELADGVAPDATLATVRARWTDPGSQATTEVERVVTLADLSDSWASTPPRFQVAAVVAAWARVLRGSESVAQVSLDDVAAAAAALPADVREDESVSELVSLTATAAAL